MNEAISPLQQRFDTPIEPDLLKQAAWNLLKAVKSEQNLDPDQTIPLLVGRAIEKIRDLFTVKLPGLPHGSGKASPITTKKGAKSVKQRRKG